MLKWLKGGIVKSSIPACSYRKTAFFQSAVHLVKLSFVLERENFAKIKKLLKERKILDLDQIHQKRGMRIYFLDVRDNPTPNQESEN